MARPRVGWFRCVIILQLMNIKRSLRVFHRTTKSSSEKMDLLCCRFCFKLWVWFGFLLCFYHWDCVRFWLSAVTQCKLNSYNVKKRECPANQRNRVVLTQALTQKDYNPVIAVHHKPALNNHLNILMLWLVVWDTDEEELHFVQTFHRASLIGLAVPFTAEKTVLLGSQFNSNQSHEQFFTRLLPIHFLFPLTCA